MKEYYNYKAAMSLGAVLLMLIATGAMVSGQQQSMSTRHSYSIVLSLVQLRIVTPKLIKPH